VRDEREAIRSREVRSQWIAAAIVALSALAFAVWWSLADL
jgi:hypothetical protein